MLGCGTSQRHQRAVGTQHRNIVHSPVEQHSRLLDMSSAAERGPAQVLRSPDSARQPACG